MYNECLAIVIANKGIRVRALES